MADVEFHDFSIKVKQVMDDKINALLDEVAGEVIAQTVRNYDTFPRVDTGNTKGSFDYKVIDSEHVAYIGSSYQNAIWEEFGTGEYALNNDGRKGGWCYVDAEGNRHFTVGKKPGRHFWKAYTRLKNKIIKHIREELKG